MFYAASKICLFSISVQCSAHLSASLNVHDSDRYSCKLVFKCLNFIGLFLGLFEYLLSLLEMERFEPRPGRQIFVHDDFCYNSNRVVGVTRYFRCALYRSHACQARANLKNDVFAMTVQHNHDPDRERVKKLRFRQELRQKASSELQPLRQIYNSEQIENPTGALAAGHFRNGIQRMMERARAKSFPPVPVTLMEFHNALTNQR